MNLYDVFHNTARKQPEKPAVLGHHDQFSYLQLDEAIEAAGDALRAAGLRPGDCVGLHLPSGVNYIIFTYAVWRRGGCVVPVPVELAVAEKQEICRDIKLDVVISEGRADSVLGPFRKHEPVELPFGLLA